MRGLRRPKSYRHLGHPGHDEKDQALGERMERFGEAEDGLVAARVGKGSRKGSTPFGRLGDVVQRPPAWAVIAAGLSATGERGRRAAVRGSVCYLSAAAAHLPIKALVGRRHPPGSARHQLGPFTSSFPSGHAASDLAFVFGAAQEMPRAFLPLSACSLAVHWSLIRKRAHYPSDVLTGGALGIAVALGMWKLWPPGDAAQEDTQRVPAGRGGEREGEHYDVLDNGDPDSPRLVSDPG
jgi:membrane-associated phospholipid phosphatase